MKLHSIKDYISKKHSYESWPKGLGKRARNIVYTRWLLPKGDKNLYV